VVVSERLEGSTQLGGVRIGTGAPHDERARRQLDRRLLQSENKGRRDTWGNASSSKSSNARGTGPVIAFRSAPAATAHGRIARNPCRGYPTTRAVLRSPSARARAHNAR